MSLSIRIPNVSFTKSVAQLYPVPESARLLSLFGGTEETSKTNLVLESEQRSLVVGTPSYASNYMTVKAGLDGYLDTDLTVAGPFSFILVAKDLPDTFVGMHTRGNTSVAYDEYLGRNNGIYRFDVEGNNAAVAAETVGWKFIAGTVSPTRHTVAVYTADAVKRTVYDRNMALQVGNTVRIGGNNNNTVDVDVAACAIYDKGLSDVEVEDVYKWMKERLAGRGIYLS